MDIEEEIMLVPLVDLRKQYLSIKDEVDAALGNILRNGSFVLGKPVSDFEQNFAKFCNTKYAVCVGNGTAALHLSFLALGIGPRDEVITVSNTFIATTEAISYTGATPVFVDIDSRTYTIDADKIEKAITPKTKAILPVHLYGHSADMDPIGRLAQKYSLFVVEDACQAHGAQYKGKRVGALGDIGAFSFYPGKNLGAYGEGGCIVTNNTILAEKIHMLRNHGSKKKYYHDIIGYNYRMDSFQGAILNVKLKYLNAWVAKRRKHASLYNKLFKAIPAVVSPFEAPYAHHTYHLYVIRVVSRDRNNLRAYLKKRGIETGIHYPLPIHLQRAYAFLRIKRGSYPLTETHSNEILSLPMFPELSEEQIAYVVDSIKDFYIMNTSHT